MNNNKLSHFKHFFINYVSPWSGDTQRQMHFIDSYRKPTHILLGCVCPRLFYVVLTSPSLILALWMHDTPRCCSLLNLREGNNCCPCIKRLFHERHPKFLHFWFLCVVLVSCTSHCIRSRYEVYFQILLWHFFFFSLSLFFFFSKEYNLGRLWSMKTGKDRFGLKLPGYSGQAFIQSSLCIKES